MKSVTSKIVVLLMAFVIFLTGMGTTIIHFCCDDCVDQFFSATINRVYAHNSNDFSDHSCCCGHAEKSRSSECEGSAKHTQKGCCKTERYSIILDSYHFKPDVFSSFVWVKPLCGESLHSLILNPIVENLNYSSIDDPPNIFNPRTYLAFIRVLII